MQLNWNIIKEIIYYIFILHSLVIIKEIIHYIFILYSLVIIKEIIYYFFLQNNCVMNSLVTLFVGLEGKQILWLML